MLWKRTCSVTVLGGKGRVAVPGSPTGGTDQSHLVGEDHSLDTVANAKFREDACDVGLHGRLGQEKCLTDLRVAGSENQVSGTPNSRSVRLRNASGTPFSLGGENPRRLRSTDW